MSETTTEQKTAAGVEEETTASPTAGASDEQLIAMLVDRARSEGLQLTGEGGLLQQLTKRVLESALEGEITDHLGYEKHETVGRGSGNSRNGTRAKSVLTDVGPVEVKVPRDTGGTFEPQIVKKRQRRLTGVDKMVLSLSAKGLTHGEISARTWPRSTAPRCLSRQSRRLRTRSWTGSPSGRTGRWTVPVYTAVDENAALEALEAVREDWGGSTPARSTCSRTRGSSSSRSSTSTRTYAE